MSIERTHRPADHSAVGGFLISGLVKNINKCNIEVLLETSVDEILLTDGAVSGVRVVDEYNDSRVLNAKSVIVATGGFSANREMVVKYRPDLEGFVTTNHKGATGSGIAMLKKIGADTVDMGEIQIHPTVEQTTSYLISEAIRGGGAILISQAGQRFYNEMETRDKVSAAIIALPEKSAWIIFDDEVRRNNKAADEYIARGFVVSAPSPQALAVKLNMDFHALLSALERYNLFVEKQDDEDFARTTALRHPLRTAPFYAIRIAPGVHHTMGASPLTPRPPCWIAKDRQFREPGRRVKWSGNSRRQPYWRECGSGHYHLRYSCRAACRGIFPPVRSLSGCGLPRRTRPKGEIPLGGPPCHICSRSRPPLRLSFLRHMMLNLFRRQFSRCHSFFSAWSANSMACHKDNALIPSLFLALN